MRTLLVVLITWGILEILGRMTGISDWLDAQGHSLARRYRESL